MIAHWDELESYRAELGHLAGTWTDLAAGAGASRIGANRISVDPRMWSTPAHIENAEEEIFYVLGGSGRSWQQLGAEGEVRMHDVGEGDCIVHLAGAERHTLKAGPDGLDVVAFGTRSPTQIGYLPRARVAWIGGTWGDVGRGDWPWAREVAAGAPEEVEPTERAANIRRRDDVAPVWDGRVHTLGNAAGAQLSGLNLVTLEPGDEGAPPHCHSAEDELFVVLAGEGTLHVEPGPVGTEFGRREEEHAVRAGHVASFPAGRGLCHWFTAGGEGLVYLAYGTRRPEDVVFYPRRGALLFKGLSVMVPVESVPFLDA